MFSAIFAIVAIVTKLSSSNNRKIYIALGVWG